MSSDYDIRQLVLMKDNISSFDVHSNNPSFLFELNSNLEGLISSLEQTDPDWIEKFREQWWHLELTIALLKEETRKKLTIEDLDIIETTTKQMNDLIDSQLSNAGKKNEQLPPWEKYPGYPPYDCFWRQPGEAWLAYVWLPYWNSLSSEEQAEYLKRWNAPEDWLSSIELSKELGELDNED